MTDWPQVHKQVVEMFTAGWDRPEPHAWDGFLAEHVELIQPMVPHARGRERWWDEVRRLLTLIPDLRADVLNWAGNGDQLFIEIRLNGTLGGKPISFRAVDQLQLTSEATVVRRESTFDSIPLALHVLTRPRAWPIWWTSGIGPFATRRRFLRR
jgi:hypothetical protein